VRIRPLPYSFVATSAPSTPNRRMPMYSKLKLMLSGSNLGLLHRVECDQLPVVLGLQVRQPDGHDRASSGVRSM